MIFQDWANLKLKNMKIISAFFLLFLSVNLFSQKLTERVAVKLYTNFDYSPKYIHHESDTTNGITLVEYEKEINGFNFSPALVLYNKKGNSSEIEISRLRYSNNYNKEYNDIDSTGNVVNILSGNRIKQFELFIRYEYKLYMFKNKDWKTIKPIIGFSTTPFVQWSKLAPLLSTEYSSSKTSVGLYLSVIPRIEYVINERWYLDLNLPLSLITTHYTTIRDDNPMLPQNERVESFFDLYNGPVSFAIRFGIGFII